MPHALRPRRALSVLLCLALGAPAVPALAAPTPAPTAAPDSTRAAEVLAKTSVRLENGTVKPAADVKPTDAVAGAIPVAPQGRLADQIGPKGADMGQLRFLPQKVKDAAAQAPAQPAAKTASASVSLPFTSALEAKPAVLRASSSFSAERIGTSFQEYGAVLGQDVSSHQAGVDFVAEKAKGSQFSYIKTTRAGATTTTPSSGGSG